MVGKVCTHFINSVRNVLLTLYTTISLHNRGQNLLKNYLQLDEQD